MKIAFTLCSLNYMHQAITLGQSLLEHNPDYKFIIGLVDKIDDRVDKSKLPPFDIIEVATVMKPDMLQDMVRRYNIIELNTSVKPFYFEYLFEKYNPEHVIYFDPDICIYRELSIIHSVFSQGYNLIVTPHSNSPKESGALTDIAFIQVGIFNFGFVAMKNTTTCKELVTWWQRRLYESCYINTLSGLFVDQLWMNLSVCYCESSYILKDEGHNMAPWNLHERKITINNTEINVNNKTPLTFFHFSGITDQHNFLKRHGQGMTFDERPDLKDLFGQYNYNLKKNNQQYFKTLDCYYQQSRVIKFYIKKILYKISSKIIMIHNRIS